MAYWSSLDTAYWNLFPSYSLVKCKHRYAVSSLMDTTYWLSEHDRKADILEAVLPPHKRLCLALGPRFKVRESSSSAAARPIGGYRADYGFIGTRYAEFRRDWVREMGYGITNDDRALLRGQVNMLRRDRQCHLNTDMLVDSEARIYDTRISSLEALVTTLVSQTTSLQTQMVAALGRIDTLVAWDPAHTNDLEDADSCTRTRTTPATATATTPITNAAIRALITQGVADALVERTIQRNTNLNGDGIQGSELALMCGRMFPDESDKVKKYVGGLLDMIQGSVMAKIGLESLYYI
nr:hypothetical protein [Tanacetum cinerariifolium]